MTNQLQSSQNRQTTDERCDLYFRALFEHPELGVIIIDRQGAIQRVNQAVCHLLGYSTQQLQGSSFWALIAKPVSAMHLDSLNPEQCYRTADGSSMVCLTTVAPIHSGDQLEFGKVVLLQQPKPLVGLEPLLNTLPMPVFFKDAHLRYQHANRAACEFFGLTPANIFDRTDAELFSTEVAEQNRRQDLQAIKQRSLFIGPDTMLSDANGKRHYFSAYKLPVISQDNQVSGLFEIMLDVTDRKLAESERLTQIQSQRDALIQEVHHRIKNHLQGVVGLLQRAIAINPLVAGPLRAILAQVESIAGIHGLQSRLRGQRLKFGQVAAMIAELTPGAVSVSGHGLDVELSHQEAVPFALTLNELVSNALKHRSNPTMGQAVAIQFAYQPPALIIQVSSGPAKLPPDFDYTLGNGLGTGLRLLKTLLPSHGAKLDYYQDGSRVVARLQLLPPLVNPENQPENPKLMAEK